MSEPVPDPGRITLALDMAGLFGPTADAQLGVAEPALDQWEAGVLRPTGEQLAELGRRAGVTVAWFYEGPVEQVPGWVCFARKVDGARCHPIGDMAQPPAPAVPVQVLLVGGPSAPPPADTPDPAGAGEACGCGGRA